MKACPSTSAPVPAQDPAELKRSIGVLSLSLYGIGVTVGAGIYVLIGETARVAGPAAPLSFILAALLIAPTAFAFAELSARFPKSAGEAVYVREAFGSLHIARLIGFLVAFAGIVSSAAVAIGSAGYVREFIDLPRPLIAVVFIVALGLVAAWGIVESIVLAVVISLVEVGALIWIVAVGLPAVAEPAAHIAAIWPPPEVAPWIGVGSGLLLAFFAFIGFEDMVNMAEEVKQPERAMPRAIALTLIVTTLLYLCVVIVALGVVPADELGASDAPLALVLSRASGGNTDVLSAVAVASTTNTVLIQLIMATRVLYGLAREKALPMWLGTVNRFTRTPLAATALVVALVSCLAAFLPISGLARATSVLILFVFLVVNLALVTIKHRERAEGYAETTPPPAFSVPFWVPVAGALLSGLVFLFEATRLLSP